MRNLLRCAVSAFAVVLMMGLVQAEDSAGVAAGGKTARSFIECVEQGGRIQAGHPRKCVSKDGVVTMEAQESAPGAKKERVCVDRCGDGSCQEIVCMAVGCPCAETEDSCPRDCKAD